MRSPQPGSIVVGVSEPGGADQGAERYRAVHAYLSDAGHATWLEVATEYGVSVSGLIEAMGNDLQQPTDERILAARLPDLVARARRVDADRRRRRGRAATDRAATTTGDH